MPLATVLVPGVYTIALNLNDAAEGVHVAAPSIPLVVVAPAPAPAPTDRRTAQSGLTDFDQGRPGGGQPGVPAWVIGAAIGLVLAIAFGVFGRRRRARHR